MRISGFPNSGPLLGVPLIRIIVCWGLFRGPWVSPIYVYVRTPYWDFHKRLVRGYAGLLFLYTSTYAVSV